MGVPESALRRGHDVFILLTGLTLRSCLLKIQTQTYEMNECYEQLGLERGSAEGRTKSRAVPGKLLGIGCHPEQIAINSNGWMGVLERLVLCGIDVLWSVRELGSNMACLSRFPKRKKYRCKVGLKVKEVGSKWPGEQRVGVVLFKQRWEGLRREILQC